MSITQSSAQVVVDGAPELPGLAFRRFRGAADYAVIASIVNAANIADDTDWIADAAEIEHQFKSLKHFDPDRDTLFAEIDGQTVGYTINWWRQEENGPCVYRVTGRVLPAWRRRGIGRALLRDSERRLRELAAEHEGDVERVFQLWSSDANAGLKAMLSAEGYVPIRYDYEMVRPDLESIPPFALPDGVEIRPATREQFRAIWEADQDAFRDHWGYAPGTEEDYTSFAAWPHNRPELWKIAWEGDQVVGQVRSFIIEKENEEFHRKRGYTESISVRRAWRRRGLARALIVASLHELKRQGMAEAALGVDAENPNGALRVYQDCGFKVTKTGITYRKPMDTAAG